MSWVSQTLQPRVQYYSMGILFYKLPRTNFLLLPNFQLHSLETWTLVGISSFVITIVNVDRNTRKTNRHSYFTKALKWQNIYRTIASKLWKNLNQTTVKFISFCVKIASAANRSSFDDDLDMPFLKTFPKWSKTSTLASGPIRSYNTVKNYRVCALAYWNCRYF
jgi:hypothetical protein